MIPINSKLMGLQRSAIRVYSNLARETEDCAMLTIGEPDFDTPENIREAAVAAIREETVRRMFMFRLMPRQEVKRTKVAKEVQAVGSGDSIVKKQPVRKEKKAGPNDPCPCGSGKKYKKCCMQKDKAISSQN